MYKLFILCSIVLCQQTACAENEIDYKWISESYIYFNKSQMSETKINPGNEYLLLTEQAVSFDQRFDFKLTINDGSIVFRPRWQYTQDHYKTELTNKSEIVRADKADMTEIGRASCRERL